MGQGYLHHALKRLIGAGNLEEPAAGSDSDSGGRGEEPGGEDGTSVETPVSFGVDLRRRRTDARLSLRALAAQVGCSHVYIAQMEYGEKPATPSMARRLDRALHADGELLALVVDPASTETSPVRTVRIPTAVWTTGETLARRNGYTMSLLITSALHAYLHATMHSEVEAMRSRGTGGSEVTRD